MSELSAFGCRAVQEQTEGILTCVIIRDGHPDGDSQPAVPEDRPEN